MTLHGIANLLNYDEYTLDLLDPDQRDASKLGKKIKIIF